MRVIHVLDHSVPLRTSYARRTLAMLAELRALGWETFQITGPKQGEGTPAEEEVEGWRFHRCPPPGGILEGVPVLGEIELMGEIAFRIEQVARRVQPHLVHAHSPVLNAIPALRVARRLGIPAVYEVGSFWEDAAAAQGSTREGSLRYRSSRALESWALRRADAVITVTEGMRREIVQRGVAAAKVALIAHAARPRAEVPAEPELRRALGLDSAFVLGLLGPHFAHEGGALVLEALKALLSGSPEVRLLAAGDGPEEPQLKEQARQMGIEHAVAFTGPLAEDQLPRYVALMDVLVSPRMPTRLAELQTPVKVLEALAQGALVVASDIGGHRELIRHGETGLLFEAGNARALATAIERVKRDPGHAEALRAATRRQVETERSWKANAEAYAALYARLTRLPARP